MNRKAILIALSGAALLGFLTAWLFVGSHQDSEQELALGAQVYADNCASCHGANLEGEADWRVRDNEGFMPAPPHDETGHTWHHSSEQLFAITKYGIAEAAGLTNYQSRMPAFEGVLTDDQIRSVLSYIEAQWPEDIRANREQRLSR